MRSWILGWSCSAIVAVACSVERPSEFFACDSIDDCAARFDEFRQCIDGYCIVPDCPADCTSCDEAAMICNVDCTSIDDCDGDIECPSGWDCRISCEGDGACNDITCRSGASCTVTCTGSNACGDVQCSSACRCDVTCATGACDTMTCPTIGNGANQVRCTVDGMSGTQCDSARDAGCAKC